MYFLNERYEVKMADEQKFANKFLSEIKRVNAKIIRLSKEIETSALKKLFKKAVIIEECVKDGRYSSALKAYRSLADKPGARNSLDDNNLSRGDRLKSLIPVFGAVLPLISRISQSKAIENNPALQKAFKSEMLKFTAAIKQEYNKRFNNI